MFFDSEALPSTPVTGFHWLKRTQSFEPSASRHRRTKRPCSTVHGAGLGSRPGSFEQPIPFPRQRTLNHGAFLFFYKIARTTLRCNQVWKPSTYYNCCTIGPIGRSSSAWRAGPSRRLAAYYRHRAASWPAGCSRFPAPPPMPDAASRANPACKLLTFSLRKA